MRTIIAGAVVIAASLVFVGTSSAQTTVTCKDGTTANAGRGACHGHGGVAKDKTSAAAAPASGGSAETVTCKDGTTANAGRGACHGHGGVAKEKTGTGTAAAPASGGSAATVTCKDGTTANAGRGACHGHGGVAKSAGGAPAAASAPAAAPAPVAAASTGVIPADTKRTGRAATTDPTGALAKCRDGMYWHGTRHSGSCSHHGGVATWLDGSK
jgi:hypothetical protein